jgi:hypothetical protein
MNGTVGYPASVLADAAEDGQEGLILPCRSCSSSTRLAFTQEVLRKYDREYDFCNSWGGGKLDPIALRVLSLPSIVSLNGYRGVSLSPEPWRIMKGL